MVLCNFCVVAEVIQIKQATLACPDPYNCAISIMKLGAVGVGGSTGATASWGSLLHLHFQRFGWSQAFPWYKVKRPLYPSFVLLKAVIGAWILHIIYAYVQFRTSWIPRPSLATHLVVMLHSSFLWNRGMFWHPLVGSYVLALWWQLTAPINQIKKYNVPLTLRKCTLAMVWEWVAFLGSVIPQDGFNYPCTNAFVILCLSAAVSLFEKDALMPVKSSGLGCFVSCFVVLRKSQNDLTL